MHAKPLAALVLVLLAAGCGGNGAYNGKSTDAVDAADASYEVPKAAVDDDRVAGPPVCSLTPTTAEGAGYRPGAPERADLAAGVSGTALTLQIKVVDVAACDPIEGAMVSVWQPDVAGATGGDLRGTQVTSSFGVVTFQTIYPGGTNDRAPHLSVRITTGADELYVGQLFFPDAVTDRVYEDDTYVGSPTRAAADPVLGALPDPNPLMLDVTAMGRDAFIASFTLGIDAP
jgi:protocatechuate 3,4-dioxygenase beta subunit